MKRPLRAGPEPNMSGNLGASLCDVVSRRSPPQLRWVTGRDVADVAIFRLEQGWELVTRTLASFPPPVLIGSETSGRALRKGPENS